MLLSGQEFNYPDIGLVRITVRRNSRSITMRWNKNHLQVNVLTSATDKDILKALDHFKSRLISRKPELRYYEEQTLQFYSLSIAIGRQHIYPDRIIAQYRNNQATVMLGDSWDFDSDKATEAISNFICKIARRAAHIDLIPRGRELADQFNLRPTDWEIGTGHRKLGHCTATKVISLSYVVLFLPPHLRDYIICHELAHLTEMNHSKKFHVLCNEYCKGREKELIAELRRFNWPVLM